MLYFKLDRLEKIINRICTKVGNPSPFFLLGIDLGTTYSCVAVVQAGSGSPTQVEVIPNQYGNRITPSVVAYTREDER